MTLKRFDLNYFFGIFIKDLTHFKYLLFSIQQYLTSKKKLNQFKGKTTHLQEKKI